MLTYADVCLDLRKARDCYERARRLGSKRAALRLSELSKHLPNTNHLTNHATVPHGVLKAAGLSSLFLYRLLASARINK